MLKKIRWTIQLPFFITKATTLTKREEASLNTMDGALKKVIDNGGGHNPSTVAIVVGAAKTEDRGKVKPG